MSGRLSRQDLDDQRDSIGASSIFTARDNDQWLKLTAPTPILEEVHSEELKAVVAVP